MRERRKRRMRERRKRLKLKLRRRKRRKRSMQNGRKKLGRKDSPKRELISPKKRTSGMKSEPTNTGSTSLFSEFPGLSSGQCSWEEISSSTSGRIDGGLEETSFWFTTLSTVFPTISSASFSSWRLTSSSNGWSLSGSSCLWEHCSTLSPRPTSPSGQSF